MSPKLGGCKCHLSVKRGKSFSVIDLVNKLILFSSKVSGMDFVTEIAVYSHTKTKLTLEIM